MPQLSTSIFLFTCAIIGMLASIELVLSELKTLKNPHAALSCDLNPLIGCSDSLQSWQGHLLFGIPNSVIGTAVFALAAGLLATWIFLPHTATTTTQADLAGDGLETGTETANLEPGTETANLETGTQTANLEPGTPAPALGARIPFLALEAGLTLALGQIAFFLYYSVTEFRTLCPYCMIVWAATILLWVHLGAALLRAGWMPVPRALARIWAQQRWLITGILLVLIVLVVAVTLSDKLVYLF